MSSSLIGLAKTSAASTGACKSESARLDELERNPRDSRISGPLRGAGDLQKSRVGGWRVVFKIDDESRIVSLVTIERRGQVYKRL